MRRCEWRRFCWQLARPARQPPLRLLLQHQRRTPSAAQKPDRRPPDETKRSAALSAPLDLYPHPLPPRSHFHFRPLHPHHFCLSQPSAIQQTRRAPATARQLTRCHPSGQRRRAEGCALRCRPRPRPRRTTPSADAPPRGDRCGRPSEAASCRCERALTP